MIDALIAGRVCGAPVSRTSATGKPFATAKVRAPTRNGEALFVNVIAFAQAAVAALLALADGDTVALVGELTPTAWTDKEGKARPGLDLLAHAVLSEYHVARKRKAVREADEPAEALPFDDPLPGAA